MTTLTVSIPTRPVVDDPNDCLACVALRELCDAHLERMQLDAAAAVAVLAVMAAERDEALYLMDRLQAEEAGP